MSLSISQDIALGSAVVSAMALFVSIRVRRETIARAKRTEELQDRAIRTDIYRKLDLMSQYRIALRNVEHSQRHLHHTIRGHDLAGAAIPEAPLTQYEQLTLEWDWKLVSTNHVRKAYDRVMNCHCAWKAALAAYDQAVEKNAKTGRPDDKMALDELDRRIARTDQAAFQAENKLQHAMREDVGLPGSLGGWDYRRK